MMPAQTQNARMLTGLLALFCGLPLLSSCGQPPHTQPTSPSSPAAVTANNDSVRPAPTPLPPITPEARKHTPVIPIRITATAKKRAVFLEAKIPPAETVHIDGQTYAVPAAWLGQKIEGPGPSPSELARVPTDLVHNGGTIYLARAARNALVAMAIKAREDNILLTIDSGFRSTWYQKKIFARQLAKGKTFAEIARFVAPPGYSEHRLGTAVDFSPSNWRFASTPQYQWLSQHAASFGFTETYPKNNPRHPWEPWHWRYRPLPSRD